MKKQQAFTITEVLITIVILGFALSLVSRIQTNTAVRLRKWKNQVHTIFKSKSDVMEYYLNPLKKSDDTVEIVKIDEKSSLKDFSKKIKIVRALNTIPMVTFILQSDENE